jgi:hypothetical protein
VLECASDFSLSAWQGCKKSMVPRRTGGSHVRPWWRRKLVPTADARKGILYDKSPGTTVSDPLYPHMFGDKHVSALRSF